MDRELEMLDLLFASAVANLHRAVLEDGQADLSLGEVSGLLCTLQAEDVECRPVITAKPTTRPESLRFIQEINAALKKLNDAHQGSRGVSLLKADAHALLCYMDFNGVPLRVITTVTGRPLLHG